jgi:hypothetical protein
MKTRLRGAWCATVAVLLALTAAAPVEAQYRRNQFGPTGATCRDACGPDCPSTCDTRRYKECIDDRRYRHVTRHTCGTHQGCRDHDRCLDNCAAAGVSQEGLDFITAQCNRECHMLAHHWAMEQYGTARGTQYVNSWRTGGGPYTGQGTWEYTKDSPDGRERIGQCPDCTQCWDNGRCRVLPGMRCEPCRSCGDVHLRTLDGLRYDLQSSGDFILVDSPDGVRVEARQVPFGRGVSVNVGAAIRVDGQVVVVALQPAISVRIDGTVVSLQDDVAVPLAGGGDVRRSGRAVVVSSPGGWQMTVRVYGSYLDVAVRNPEALRGRLAGLLGNADGDPSNDLVARDGTRFAIEIDQDDLYDRFAGSWRLSPDDSLLADLPWPDGLARSGTGRPDVITTLASFSDEQLQVAADLCLDAGLDAGPRLDICVFDVAATGDPEMALGAAVSAEGVLDVTVRAPDKVAPEGEVTLSAVSEAVAGSRITVGVRGASGPSDYVTVVPVGTAESLRDNHAWTRGGDSVELRLPPEPGPHELRYVRDLDRVVRATRPLQVMPLQVELVAEPRARAGSRLAVRIDGEGHADDLVAIVQAGAAQGDIGNHQRRAGRDTLEVLVPATPGRYEIRYMLDQRRHQVTARPLDVDELDLELVAAGRAPAGGNVQVRITGAANDGDLVVVVPAGAPDTDIGAHVRTVAGVQEVTVRRLPAQSGQYELRYVIDQGRRVVVRRRLDLE